MRKKKGKLIAMLLTCMLVFGLLPFSVFAAAGDPVDVWVGGVQMQEEYYLASGATALTDTKPDDTTGYAYMKSATELVLHNYSFTGGGYTDSNSVTYALYSALSEALTVTLEGTNAIDADEYGISVWDDLTITGSGTLSVEAEPYAILGGNSDISIIGSTVTVDAKYDGISTWGALLIQDSEVEVISDEDDAISTGDDISIMESTVTAHGGYSGIYTNGNLLIQDSAVEAISNADYDGIYTGYDLTITDSTVSVRGVDDGIYTEGDLLIQDSAVEATGDNYGGIFTSYDLTITSSTVTAHGEFGIDTVLLTVTDSEVTASGETTGIECCGLIQNSGTITATGPYEGICDSYDGELDEDKDNIKVLGGILIASSEEIAIVGELDTLSYDGEYEITAGDDKASAVLVDAYGEQRWVRVGPKEIPPTGDASHMAFFAGLMLLAALGAGFVIVKSRKCTK